MNIYFENCMDFLFVGSFEFSSCHVFVGLVNVDVASAV